MEWRASFCTIKRRGNVLDEIDEWTAIRPDIVAIQDNFTTEINNTEYFTTGAISVQLVL